MELVTKRKQCSCGGNIYPVKPRSVSTVTLYTTSGIQNADHIRSSCQDCRKYFYFGYCSSQQGKSAVQRREFDEDALDQTYLITSHSTGFEIKLLYDWSLQILISFANFEGLSEIYNSLHGGDQNFDIRHNNEQNGGDGWLKLNEKRVREAWFTYALIELRQRYQLTGDIATNIETAMEENQYVLQDVFRQRWSTHRCNIDGCGSVIVIGNL